MQQITNETLDKDKVCDYFKKDGFSSELGISIDDVSVGKSICSLKIRDNQKNAGGFLQGGVSYTLGDFAFAVAANSYGKATVTLTNNISYISAAKEGTITAYANVIARTNKTCTAVVDIKDENDKQIAYLQVTGYILNQELDFAK